jgi:hypothetical protein
MKIERSYAADRLHVREPKYKGRTDKMLYTDRSRVWKVLKPFLCSSGFYYSFYYLAAHKTSFHTSLPVLAALLLLFTFSLGMHFLMAGVLRSSTLNVGLKEKHLKHAYMYRSVHEIRHWLEKGAAPEAKYLLCAAEDGYEDIVRLFLDYGADVNAKWDGKSALAWAIEKGHVATVKILLGRGASVDTTWDGKSALAWAIEKGHVATVKILLGRGASVDTTWGGKSALAWAIKGGNLDIEAALVHAGADFDADSFCRSKQQGGKALFFALLGRFARRKDRDIGPHGLQDAADYRGALQESRDVYTNAEHAFVGLILAGHAEAALTGGCISGQPAAPNDLTAGVDCEAKLSSDELFSVICSLQDLGALKRSVSDSLPLALTSREMLGLCRDQELTNGLAPLLRNFLNGNSRVDSAPQQVDRHRLEGAVCRAVFPTSPKAFPPADAFSTLPPGLLSHIGGFLEEKSPSSNAPS